MEGRVLQAFTRLRRPLEKPARAFVLRHCSPGSSSLASPRTLRSQCVSVNFVSLLYRLTAAYWSILPGFLTSAPMPKGESSLPTFAQQFGFYQYLSTLLHTKEAAMLPLTSLAPDTLALHIHLIGNIDERLGHLTQFIEFCYTRQT